MRAVLFLLLAAVLTAQPNPSSPYEQAAGLFQQGRLEEAETALRTLLGRDGGDVRALMLLGVVLDSAKRYADAGNVYDRALSLAPRSAPLLNNAANHSLAAGDPKRAESLFRRLLDLDPHHANANLHLSEMRLAENRGTEALAHLDRLPPPAQAEPVAQLLRGRALAQCQRCTESAAVLGPLHQQTSGDPSFSFSIGMAYAACKRYTDAEALFSKVLETDPANFDVLYNLGLVARHANHMERAKQVFEIALRQRPDDPDALYGMAEVLGMTGDRLMAVTLLYRLHRFEPKRADSLLLLCRTTADLGYFDEAAAGYQKYLALRPKDEIARREWGFALAQSGNAKDAIPPLAAYAAAHPADARGQYELAIAEALLDHQKGLRRLDRALALDANLSPARYARAVLRFQEEEPAAAMEDFQFLLKHDPENAQLLDWVGQVHLRMDHANEAATVLKHALDRTPRDRAVLMHYSRALRELNRGEELAAVLATFERVASTPDAKRQRRGLFEFLDLPSGEQRSRYIAFLEKAVALNPSDTILKARWAHVLLEQGKSEKAAAAYREILALDPDSTVLQQCGNTLLRYAQYGLAAEFLRTVPDSRLDLAIALFHSAGPEAGLSELEKVQPAERQGDYYLVRAQMLDASQKPAEAADALNRGIRANPRRADTYFQAALFLIKHGRREEAAKLLEDASRLLPDASELLLARAIALELLQRRGEAAKLLSRIQSRWPEWDLPYLVHGIVLVNALKPVEAKQMLETAIALGVHGPEAYYYLALAITRAIPDKMDEARNAIVEAVKLAPEDYSIRYLAGKVFLSQENYAPALEHLTKAVQLEPNAVEAHYALIRAYRETGDRAKAHAEAELVEELTRQKLEGTPAAPSLERLLPAVSPGASPTI